MVTVRSYGLYANSKAEAPNRCRALLGQAPAQKSGKLAWQDLTARRGDQHPDCCPICGRRLVAGGLIEPQRRAVTPLPRHRSGAPPNRTSLPKVA